MKVAVAAGDVRGILLLRQLWVEVGCSLRGRTAVEKEEGARRQVAEVVVQHCSWSLLFVWVVVVGSDSVYGLRL